MLCYNVYVMPPAAVAGSDELPSQSLDSAQRPEAVQLAVDQ